MPYIHDGMHLFDRKDKVEGDAASRMLMKQGVYHVPHHRYDHPYHMDSGTIKRKKIYGFWPGMKYVIILSFLLFWLPPFGQIVAGYVGGRKAGTPLKGLFAALIPVCFVFFVFGLARIGIMTGLETLWSDGVGFIFTTAASLPLIGPIAGFSIKYLGFFSGSIGTGIAWLAPYALTVVFGYVGGVLSLHHRRELEEFERASIIPYQSPAPVAMVAAPTAPTNDGNEIIGMDGDIPVVMGNKPDGWDDK
ncbi:MAG: hypothetical protein KAS67_00230 [Thermoplasmata archaeon]|nr:hypothetical protein [Thermoplasmata archaeon]